ADAGGAGMVKIAADFRRAFPDARWQIDLVFGEGDFVAFGLMEQVGAHVYAGAAPPKIPAEDGTREGERIWLPSPPTSALRSRRLSSSTSMVYPTGTSTSSQERSRSDEDGDIPG